MGDTDGQVTVQDGVASTPEPAGATSEPTTAPAFDETKIAEIVAKEIAKVTTDLESKSQKALRDVQSQKDRAIAELQRRAQMAEATLNTVRSKVAQQSPELAESLEADGLRSQLSMYQEQERQRQYAEAMQKVVTDFRNEMSEFVKDNDINESDPEYAGLLEEAIQNNQLGVGSRKIHKLVAERNKAAKASLQQQIQAEVAKALKDRSAEVNSVETSNPVGTTAGKRVYTTAELSDPVFVRANLADITKAQSEGRIK